MDSEPGVSEGHETLAPPDKGTSPVALGVITLSALILYFWLSGSFLPEADTGFWMTPVKSTGTVLTYAVIPAFVLAMIGPIRRRTHFALQQLCATKTIDVATAKQVLACSGFAPTAMQNLAISLVGLIAGVFNVPWERVIADLGTPTASAGISIAAGNLITWLAVSHMASRAIAISTRVNTMGREHARVDLFRLDALLPFGRMGVFDLLIVTITVSFAVFQSLDAEFRWDSYASALVVGIPIGLALLLLPMLGIRQNVRARKNSALSNVDELVANASRALDPESMGYLGDLLQRRERLEKVREWPLDTTTFSRIAIYVVLPPLAWLGGALVEILLGAAIDAG